MRNNVRSGDDTSTTLPKGEEVRVIRRQMVTESSSPVDYPTLDKTIIYKSKSPRELVINVNVRREEERKANIVANSTLRIITSAKSG